MGQFDGPQSSVGQVKQCFLKPHRVLHMHPMEAQKPLRIKKHGI